MVDWYIMMLYTYIMYISKTNMVDWLKPRCFMERNNLQKGPSFHFHGSSKQRALVDLEASKEEAVRNVYLGMGQN